MTTISSPPANASVTTSTTPAATEPVDPHAKAKKVLKTTATVAGIAATVALPFLPLAELAGGAAVALGASARGEKLVALGVKHRKEVGAVVTGAVHITKKAVQAIKNKKGGTPDVTPDVPDTLV